MTDEGNKGGTRPPPPARPSLQRPKPTDAFLRGDEGPGQRTSMDRSWVMEALEKRKKAAAAGAPQQEAPKEVARPRIVVDPSFAALGAPPPMLDDVRRDVSKPRISFPPGGGGAAAEAGAREVSKPRISLRRSGVSDAVNPYKVLGNTFDAMIRSVKTASTSVDLVSQRVLELWREEPDAELQLEATKLLISFNEALEASGEEGRWLLPAFMAGLRRIRMNDARPDDLARLAIEFASLEASIESISRFQDWLWSDGAEGFVVSLDVSFAETIDVAIADEAAQKKALAAIRVEAASALESQAVRIASRLLDLAAARDEFQVPLDLYARDVGERRFSLQESERRDLAIQCEDTLFWIDGEVFLILAHPEMRTSMPPKRLARRVLSMLSKSADLRFVGLLAQLSRRQDEGTKALLQAFEEEPIGETLAANIVLDEKERAGLCTLLAAPASRVNRGLVHGLLDRCVKDSKAFDAVVEILATVGVNNFYAKVELPALSDKAAIALGRLLIRSQASPALLAEIVGKSAPKVAAAIVAETPPALLLRLRAKVEELLEKAPVDENSEIARVLLQQKDDRWLQLLVDTLVETGGKRWHAATTGLVCSAVLDRRRGREVLVPLARSYNAKTDLRLLVLDVLEKAPDLLAEATRWSFQELFEKPEIKDRMKKTRRDLRARRRGAAG